MMAERRHSELGISIPAVMVIVILVAGITSAFLVLAMNENSVSGKSRNKMKALYCAEAGAEHAANIVRVAISTNPTAADDVLGDVTIGTWPDSVTVHYVAKKRTDLPDETDESGLYTQRQSYEILAECTVNQELGRVFRIVEARTTPIFQFLAFYNDDLEANPGPAAYWNGRIHTNGNLYLTDRDGSASTKSGHGLIIDSEHVQAVGSIYRKYKNDVETGANGRVRIRQKGTTPPANTGTNYDADKGLIDWDLGYTSDSANWSTSSQTDFGGTVKDKHTGSSEMTPPDLKSIEPDGFFHQNAADGGLVILDNEVYSGGQNITKDLENAGIITPGQSVYDAREKLSMPVMTIDVGKLMNSSYRPSNGLIYGGYSGNSASNPKSFQLVNGGTIPPSSDPKSTPNGLTFVSNSPVYVKGDYNGRTYTDADYTAGTITDKALIGTQDKSHASQPCAIIADAVNLLSNKWDNTKKAGSAAPAASHTTFNFAMIAGNRDTVNNKIYSGGLQNLPRFHENWSGITCNIKGSFVNLWRSKIADGDYGNANVFSPPKRLWDFDQTFNDPSQLPPWTPKVTKIGRTTYEEGLTRPANYDLEVEIDVKVGRRKKEDVSPSIIVEKEEDLKK